MSGWRKVSPEGVGEDGEPATTPKQRVCLRCRGPFTSTWAGERICPHCKGSGAWRNGLPLPSRPPSSGRT